MLRPTPNETVWGNDWLGRESIDAGEVYDLRVRPLVYDVLLKSCQRDQLLRLDGVNVSQATELLLYDGSAAPTMASSGYQQVPAQLHVRRLSTSGRPTEGRPSARNGAAVRFIGASSSDAEYLARGNCGFIENDDLEYFCRGNCSSINNDDLEAFCNTSCTSIQDDDLEYFCRGTCGSIDDDNLESLCRGDCTQVTGSLRPFCQ